MSELNLQTALHRIVSAIQVGQQRGSWAPQESILLNEAITFFVKTPVMVVPPPLLQKLAHQKDTSINSLPLGSESVQS